jgi:ornithine cyclodeaminase/alanine dehydrogenase-like protein (mu-crystallin family)
MSALSQELLFLSRRDIEAIDYSISDIITRIEEVFKEKGEGNIEMPPKPGIHTKPDAFIHAMPAYIPEMGAAGIKWISGYPDNLNRGLPYITGLLVLNDPDTGSPIALMDATWITAKRTGAATAVAAKHLARRDSSVFAILGCGVQGRTNLEALNAVFDLNEARAYDISRDNLQRYREEMTAKFGLSIKPARDPHEAVMGSDIIVTAGPILKDPTPSIERSWVSDGVFACPIDYDSYWKPEAIHSMHKFCTDDEQQLLYYKSMGYFRDIPNIHADLGEIVLGRKTGRENQQERIMSMNLGLAIEDMAVASVLYERARKLGIGQWLML